MTTQTPTVNVADLTPREHEVFTHIVAFTPWVRCQHGKQLVTVRAHWSDDAPFTCTTGYVNSTQTFDRVVHADGSESSSFEYNVVEHHAACGAMGERGEVWTRKLLSYGDLSTCKGCGHEVYTSIGD